MDRKLDGIFFRIKRNDKFENVCVSDMTDEERNNALKDKNKDFLLKIINILANTLYEIGETFDISKE